MAVCNIISLTLLTKHSIDLIVIVQNQYQAILLNFTVVYLSIHIDAWHYECSQFWLATLPCSVHMFMTLMLFRALASDPVPALALAF